MKYRIAIAKGDGIGPEVVESAIKILDRLADKFNHSFIYEEVAVGGYAYDIYGDPLPRESLDICKKCQAILFGAVGGPKWDGLAGDKRPEQAILGLRKELGLYANLRPGILFNPLKDASPLKESIIADGFDIMVVRELTGGIYFGDKGYRDTPMGRGAYDVEFYSEKEIERIARLALDMAMQRNRKLTSVDKANVLESSRLWRKIVEEIGEEYPKVELEHMYVDNAAMQLIRNPRQFDVILTNNMFGDILSDEISVLTGSIGLLPSVSLGEKNKGLYEPIHGSAPDISGTNRANPIAAILSAALMLKYSMGLEEEGRAIERAVHAVLADGYRTEDTGKEGDKALGTVEMTQVIENKLGK